MILPIEEVLKEVCRYYEINPVELFAKNRKRAIVEKRQVFCYISVIHTSRTMDEIGEMALKYERNAAIDHATVRHGKIAMENLIVSDKTLRKDVSNILKALRKHEHKKYTNTEIVFKKEIDRLYAIVSRIEEKLNSQKLEEIPLVYDEVN